MGDFKRSSKILELDKILKLLCEFTHCEETKKLALNLTPSSDISLVQKMGFETDEALILSFRFGSPNFFTLLNPFNAIKGVKLGLSMDNGDLLNIASILRQARILNLFRERNKEYINHLNAYFDELEQSKDLESLLFKSILSKDSISDDASEELKRIRNYIRRQKQKIRDTLESFTKGSKEKYLQDAIVTIRDNRYVVPVKAEYKTEIPGLLHDVSASGSTLFIEPTSVVEANNELRVMFAKEEEELKKILRDLSLKCLENSDLINKNYKNILALDLIFAKANLGAKMNAILPKITDDGKICLKNARHPLIDNDVVVPINIEIGNKYRSFIITGPNTGGKTVALKTIGLLTTMTMCGLLIPVGESSQVSIFNNILVDIGDEQSIEQSLSTFSSHMTNIVSILNTVDEKSLVLIDELGSGTDPEEGAALSIAIVEEISKKRACLAATTHYNELKVYALEIDNIENACFEFDVNTLKPTYKLLIGVPGQSNAFAISSRIGLSDEIINRARQFMSGGKNSFDKVIGDLESLRKDYEKELKKQRQASLVIENAKKQIKEKQDYVDKQTVEKLEKAQEQAKYIVDNVRSHSNRILNELEEIKKKKDKENPKELLISANSIAKSELNALYKEATPVIKRENENYKLKRELKVGDIVLIYDINKKGQVVKAADKSGVVLVRIGQMNLRSSLDNLRFIEEEKPKKFNAKTKKSVVSKLSRSASTEIDLRGDNVEEALAKLDRFIDGCVLSNIEIITIIHGKGSGILRKAINKYLKNHPCIRSQRLGVFGEGEDGVTIATIK